MLLQTHDAQPPSLVFINSLEGKYKLLTPIPNPTYSILYKNYIFDL